MRYPPEHKQLTAERMLSAAGRGFRAGGFGGVGVDALAHAAGVTSGAFYKHFPSKSAAFRAAVEQGLAEFAANIERLFADPSGGGMRALVDYYFSEQHLSDLASSCVVPGLTADVARSDDETRAIYTDGIERVVAALCKGLPAIKPALRRERAWMILSMLAGGVQLCRAVGDPALVQPLARQLHHAVLELAGESVSAPAPSKLARKATSKKAL